MNNLGIILIIFAVLLGLQAIADEIKLPNAVLLVIVGLSLWFIPGLPQIELNPDVIFLLFLPPILWSAAFFTSLREFKANVRPISLLAVGLVVSIFQAATQINEMTLSFIPKLVGIFLAMIIAGPWMLSVMLEPVVGWRCRH